MDVLADWGISGVGNIDSLCAPKIGIANTTLWRPPMNAFERRSTVVVGLVSRLPWVQKMARRTCYEFPSVRIEIEPGCGHPGVSGECLDNAFRDSCRLKNALNTRKKDAKTASRCEEYELHGETDK